MGLAIDSAFPTIEVVPPLGSEESLRITVEAHTPEVVGIVPVYDDVALVVAILLLFALFNAIWSAPEGSWLGIIRKALAGDRIDGLFLGINLRLIGHSKSRQKTERRAYLISLSRRHAEVYAEDPLPKGDLVTIESEAYGKFQARVGSCYPVWHEGGWFKVRLRLKDAKLRQAGKIGLPWSSRAGAVALLWIACLLVGVAGNPKSTMNALLESLTCILELSFDREEFAASRNRPAVEARLARLVQAAESLEKHAKSRERGFEFVAQSLGRDLRETQRSYRRGDFEDARRSLHNLTDNCIACHVNLAEGRQLPPSERFFSNLRSKSLQPLAIAHYQLVTRQFDAALATFESIFTAPGVEKSLLPLSGFFGDYLKVCVGVKGDFGRPRRLLLILINRPETPMYLRGLFQTWTSALTEIEQSKPYESLSLDRAEKLLSRGHDLMDSMTDRSGLVHYLTAENLLLRFVKSRPDTGLDVARAYYLLGNAASLSEHSLWIARAPYYYESAIRMAQEADFSLKAYAALQDRFYSEAVLDGRRLDPETLFLLEELNEILENARQLGRKT